MSAPHRDLPPETRLEQILAFLRAIVETVPCGVFVKDTESRFIAANREIAEVMGVSEPAALEGKTDREFYPPEMADEYFADERRIFETGIPLDRKSEPKVIKGETRRILVTKHPVFDALGEVVGIVGVTEDVTERRREQEKTEIERNLLRTVVDLVPHSIYAKDAEYRKTLANPLDLEVLGVKTETEAVGKDDYAFFPKEIAAAFIADDENVVKYGISIIDREEYYFDHRQRKRWLLTSKVPLRNSNGQIVGLVGIGKDITAQKEADEKIREQAQLLDIASDSIFVLDIDNRIRYWNKSAERCYGWAADAAMEKDVRSLLYSARPEETESAMKAVQERGTWIGDLHHTTKEGTEGIAESRWTLVRDENGAPSSVLCVSTDVTEDRSVQAQLFRAQRLESIGTLAGGIAHDLNNVLTPILMGLESLGNEDLSPEHCRLVELLKGSAHRGANIVRQVLGFARGVEGEKSEIQVRLVLQDVEQILRETFPKSIELRVELPDDLWTVMANATQIHQVVMNLCVNARDAMLDGGTLSVSAENMRVDETYARLHIDARPIPYVVLKVEDSGAGIPPKILERIFDPFFTTKEPGKGTGLGLSTAMTIIKGYGGFMNAYSEVGKGSSFKVYLPAVPTRSSQTDEKMKKAGPNGNGELILVVDDEEAVRDVVRSILESHGYRTLAAEDGTAAIALYTENRAEVGAVLIDMVMPYMDGASTIRALRRLASDIRIVATSGLLSNGYMAEARSLSVGAFLPKPYTTETLLEVLRGVLDQPR